MGATNRWKSKEVRNKKKERIYGIRKQTKKSIHERGGGTYIQRQRTGETRTAMNHARGCGGTRKSQKRGKA